MRTLRIVLALGALAALPGVLSIGCGGSADSAETATGTTTGTSTATGHGGAGGAGGHATSSTGAGGAGGAATTTGTGGAGGTTSGAGGTTTTSTAGTGGGTTTTSGIVTCVWGKDECGPGQLCHAPGCGTGMCVPKNANPPNMKNAVCGCDGVTYWNGGVASAHAMSPKHDGACESAEDVNCGGFAGLQCDKGLFCNYADTELACGASDALGSCWGMPLVCPNPDQPGSGADVRTCLDDACSSECAAIRSEARYYLADGCGGGGGGGGGGGSTTTSSTGSSSTTTTTTSTAIACSWGSDVCGPGQYCNAPGCDKGVCAPLFGKVSTERKPVCGCDGVTYWNESLAKNAGVAVRVEDACAKFVATPCAADKPCAAGESCNLRGNSPFVCNNLKPTGSCWKLPSVCGNGIDQGFNMRDCQSDKCESECKLIKAQTSFHADDTCFQEF